MFKIFFYVEKNKKTFQAVFENEKGFGEIWIKEKIAEFKENGYKIKKYHQIHVEKKK